MTEALRERVRGRWRAVLPALGVAESFLNGKHQACPLCGGKDRARFDDKDGGGTWICSQCGAGDGISLLMKLRGWDFKTAAQNIEAIAGTAPVNMPPKRDDPARQLEDMRRLWRRAGPISDQVRTYLDGRGLDAEALRDVRQLGNDMIALVRAPNGEGGQIHRTRLTVVGQKVSGDCRLFMPGPIPKGSAVRLMRHEGEIGIAEGIETALSAAKLFGLPVWAALNANMLKQWEPPADLNRIVIFGDNDANNTGQAAAYELARRLSGKAAVSVEIPKQAGQDWNDVLLQKGNVGKLPQAEESDAA